MKISLYGVRFAESFDLLLSHFCCNKELDIVKLEHENVGLQLPEATYMKGL